MKQKPKQDDDPWTDDDWYANILGTGSYSFIGVGKVKSKLKHRIGFVRQKKKREKKK